MDNEADLKLAFAMHASPGAYALLLGSGLSTSAGIPTGWDIVLDLITRLAIASGEDSPDDPEKWYADRFGEEADYSKLLHRLARTPTERLALLRSYFEATEQERDEGLKTPTAAHTAIAQLVSAGYVKVILTTNFDPLLEQALEGQGVHPTVVASEDAMSGAPPLHQVSCMVVKLHGDYRDTRIRNTPDELATYPKALNRFLDGIFDDYGLVVSGWSGEWDIALRDALSRCRSRRYSMYWLTRTGLRAAAQQIITQRGAEVITGAAAEVFFPSLWEKLVSLRDMSTRHPASTAVAVATLKRYVADERHRVSLHDLIADETEEVHAATSSLDWDSLFRERTRERFQHLMRQTEASCQRLCALMAALAYHGDARDARLLTRCIERLIQTPERWSRNQPDLWFYPAVLVTYSAGLASMAAKRYENLHAVLCDGVYHESNREDKAALTVTHALGAFGSETYKWVPREKAASEYTPASNHVHDHLRDLLHEYLPDDVRYSETFDVFEFVLGLVYFDIVDEKYGAWSPPGRFMWRWRDDWDTRPGVRFVTAIKAEGGQSPFLKAGFFGGSQARMDEKLTVMREWAGRIGRSWH